MPAHEMTFAEIPRWTTWVSLDEGIFSERSMGIGRAPYSRPSRASPTRARFAPTTASRRIRTEVPRVPWRHS